LATGAALKVHQFYFFFGLRWLWRLVAKDVKVVVQQSKIRLGVDTGGASEISQNTSKGKPSKLIIPG